MKTKLIAFYLPQFHSIKENDEWWGEGFTEWINTKKATPLYKGHYQPQEPLEDNYYSLLDAKTQEWQAKLAKKYGIYGFCYYHYWFNGKMLLEKPMENMLNNKNIDLPFCISWANETWSRRWTGQEKEILIRQEYGGERDWKNHIEYLIPFFKDERYIKVNNKPVMLIYTTSKLEKCDEMVEYWNNYLKEEGFAGIYIAETLSMYQIEPSLKNSSAQVEFEPLYTTKKIKDTESFFKRGINWIRRRIPFSCPLMDAKKYWMEIENAKRNSKKEIFLGTFPRWDNSPRRGRKGFIFKNADPQAFEQHLTKLYKKAVHNKHRFIFLNAWNEWGEGAYLEPDKKYKYKYLEACKNAIAQYEEE